MRFIEIEQIYSPIRRPGSKRATLRHPASQRATLIGLGLNRIGCVRWVPDTPQFRGMIDKISHLVKINNDPGTINNDPNEPKSDSKARVSDDADDEALIRELAFDANGIEAERYSDAALKRGKTPDFKLFKNARLCGFCEMKSPRDDAVFEAPQSGFAVRKNLPFYRKLGSHIRRAARQFDAENPNHKLPNILAFVTYSTEIERRDLIATIAGLPPPVDIGRRIFMLGRKMQEQVMHAARTVDLFLWIDAQKRTCQHLSVNGAPHQARALELLGLS